MYDPATGRYIQSDPIGLEGGLNTYGYVNGNPLMLYDVYGLWSVSVSAYYVLGGGVNVAYSDNTLEVTGRIGAGFGGGAMFNSSGKVSEHAKSCGSGYIARTTYEASIGIGAGPIGVGFQGVLSTGNAVTTPIGGDFKVLDSNFLLDSSYSIGVKRGASVGVEFGSYTNW